MTRAVTTVGSRWGKTSKRRGSAPRRNDASSVASCTVIAASGSISEKSVTIAPGHRRHEQFAAVRQHLAQLHVLESLDRKEILESLSLSL